ncbi:MAG TPA: hypothetical protein VJQ50_12615 [Terriglobales bacterium]|jgi:hypothetical protein|nr:hypothetical protein [Terriglobales bacterium]
MDAVQQTARLLSPALFRHGRILVAPPSRHNCCWRVFGGGLTGEVIAHDDVRVCSYTLKGPDGKILRQGVTSSLASALRLATELLCQLCKDDYEAAA